MASAKIEALKAELTVSLSRSIVSRDDLFEKIEETVIMEVVSDLQRKASEVNNAYSYGSKESRSHKLEILVDHCKAFIDFAHEIRTNKVLKLTAGDYNHNDNGEV